MRPSGERIYVGKVEKRRRLYWQVRKLLIGDALSVDGGRLLVLCVQPAKRNREYWLLERQEGTIRPRGTFAQDCDVSAVTGRRKRELAVMCSMVTSWLLRRGVSPEDVAVVEGGAMDAPLARPAWVKLL